MLDRATGRFLLGKPFVKVNWMSEFDERGRPKQTPQPAGQPTYPGNQGGTNWYSPSYSPRTGLFYVSAWEDYASIYAPAPSEYKEGTNFGGGGPRNLSAGARRAAASAASPINNWTEAAGHGAVIALDPGDRASRSGSSTMTDVTDSGILTTASDLLFTGGREGYLPGARRADRRAAVEDAISARDQQRPDHLSRRQPAVRLRSCPGSRCSCSRSTNRERQ